MSLQETSSQPPQSEAKLKPPIPHKPSSQRDSSTLENTTNDLRTSGGKVKMIVHRFSQPEVKPPAKGGPTANGTSKPTSKKQFKRAPTIKPKPVCTSLPVQLPRGDQAPPLPLKRSRILQQQSEQAKRETLRGDEGNEVSVERGRSAPDGREVELQLIGGGEGQAGHSADTPLTPCCDTDCTCVCHFQRPGMKLIWVPIEEEEEEEEENSSTGDEEEYELVVLEDEDGAEEEVDSGEEGESKAGSMVDERRSPVAPEREAKHDKAKFQQVLDVMIAEGNCRRSDPGPHTIITSLSTKRPESPPVPPKRSQSPSTHHTACQNEEEEIYADTLLVVELPNPCTEPNATFNRMRKPVRRGKLSSSNSDPTSEFQTDLSLAPDISDGPPAIPPRKPVPQERSKGGPGAIPLPQPTMEEWRALRPSSPDSLSVSPLRAPPPTPTNPIPSGRTLSAAPMPQPRRLSSASVQSLASARNGGEEEEKEESEEAEGPTARLRRGSAFDWESSLQDEPLYQTYRSTVITKEIRRQTVCRNISKTSADYAMDWGNRGGGTGNGGPRSSPVPMPGQSTLWQDLPAVRESGVLEQLTSEQLKYQESMFEVLTSEASYLRSLLVLTEHFMENHDLEETLIIRDRKTLFSSVLRIREVSERFLKDLGDRMDESLVFDDICDIIHYHAQHNFPAYIDYVRNQIYQEKIFTSLMKNNVQFATVITRLQESPQCQRLPFMSFLLLPFQRITRIKMLIENILKRTKEKTKEEQTASKALDSVSKIIEECNTQVGKMKQVEELIHLSKTLDFDKLKKAIPIISQTRFLEKKGELQEMSKGGTLFQMRAKFSPIHLFLFNDLLIIAAKKGSERFVVLDHAHRSLVQVQRVEETGSGTTPYEHCFNITLLENHQGRMMERLLKAPSQSDMHRWMAAFPNPSNPDGDEEEVIYEDWDCPQVQCVDQYIALQADELTLEPTEIINIVRKTNEGWYEGIRLSDGQKGWFPVSNVLEITNEHVRRRNLRERYRVMQAAGAVVNINKSKTAP